MVLSGSDKAPPTVATPVTFNFCVVVTPATMKSPKTVPPIATVSNFFSLLNHNSEAPPSVNTAAVSPTPAFLV